MRAPAPPPRKGTGSWRKMSLEESIFPLDQWYPQLLGLGHPLPRATPLTGVSPVPPVPTFRPPQVDSPSAFPHFLPACPPGPGEFRRPSLQLKLHSGPGAEPVSVALSLGEGQQAGRLAGAGHLDLSCGGTQRGPSPTVTRSFLLPTLSVPVTFSLRNMWSATSAGRGPPSTAP